MPRQIPKKGLSCLMYAESGSVNPLELRVSIALPKDPTPGKTMTYPPGEQRRQTNSQPVKAGGKKSSSYDLHSKRTVNANQQTVVAGGRESSFPGLHSRKQQQCNQQPWQEGRRAGNQACMTFTPGAQCMRPTNSQPVVAGGQESFTAFTPGEQPMQTNSQSWQRGKRTEAAIVG